MKRMIDITGQRFGRYTVIKFVNVDDGGNARWECKCDCGNVRTVLGTCLRNGTSVSCGCYRKERASKHGLHDSRLYGIWSGMRQRCEDINASNYSRYGGRGIAVCEEWEKDFQAFYDWSVRNGYAENLTIERIDNEGNYCPENCRWTTTKEQANNKRNNHLISHKGETHTLTQWAEIKGINAGTLWSRINDYGWDIEKALTAPVRKREK